MPSSLIERQDVGLFDRFTEAPVSFQAALVFLLSALKYGIGIFTSWQVMLTIAQHIRSPFTYVPWADSFRLSSSTMSVVAGALHITSPRGYLGLGFIFAVGALLSPFMTSSVRHSKNLRVAVSLVLVGGAIPAILLGWIGGYDAVTIGAMSFAVLGENSTVRFLGWTFVAFNNLPEAVVAAALCVGMDIYARRRDLRRRITPLIAGVATGGVFITALVSRWGGASRVAAYQLLGPGEIVRQEFRYLPLTMLSALGVAWVLLSARELRRVREVEFLLIAAVLTSLIVPAIAWDESRVVATVLFAPLLMALIAVVEHVDDVHLTAALRRTAPYALLLITVLAFDGGYIYAGWTSVVQFVAFMAGHGAVPFGLA